MSNLEIGQDLTINKGSTHLDGDRYIKIAIDATRLDDFGSTRFLHDYRALIDAINAEVQVSETGMLAIEEFAVRMLINRLRMYRDIKVNPGILEEKIAPPIVITGFPRTGSTKLQRMLSASPDVRALPFWQMLNVAPFPDANPGGPDPRIAAAFEVEAFMKAAYPEVWATHPTPALDADEDFLLHELSFLAPTIPMRMGGPKLVQSLTPLSAHLYSELRTTLQYLQWQNGGKGHAVRPFVLKSPVHIGSIETLLDIFPGAKIIHCHRAIEISITSTVSMMDNARRIFLTDVDAHAVGNDVMHYWANEWTRNIEQRERIPPDSFCDVSFADINANAMAVIEQIYTFAGLTMNDGAKQAMLAWEANNSRHKHGTRSYLMESYGLTPDAIRSACAPYLAKLENSALLGTTESAA